MTELMELFKKALDGIQDKLVEEVAVDSGLWTKLKAKKVLSGRQIRTCEMMVLLIMNLWITENTNY